MQKFNTILEVKEPNVWNILSIMILTGIFLDAAFGSQVIIWKSTPFIQNFLSYLYAIGTIILIAGASFSAGGLTGFLFGIPRMLQNPLLLPEDGKNKRRAISQNDNLVQISDWVTKIMVGIGLTTIYKIPPALFKLGTILAPSFSIDPNKGRNAAIATILYFLIVGFLSIYLWTRIYFTKMLNKLEIDLDDELRKEIETIKTVNNEIQENNLNEVSNKITPQEAIQQLQIKTDNETRNPTEIEYFDDPQKGKWGGKSESNDRKISAIVEDSIIPNFYVVTITVESTNKDKPLKGYVRFHLHNTFKNPNPIIAVQDDKAVLRLKMVYGAFTVGAEADEGNTKLELDLAELSNAPQKFKER